MEKLDADGVTYHKKCFRCAVCNKAISVGGYAALEGKVPWSTSFLTWAHQRLVYCKPHFKQLFQLKGNYNEGFGSEPHKNKWTRPQTMVEGSNV
jgi:hypothetical protein